MAWMVKYQLGFAEMQEAIGRAIATLAGTREQDLRARTVTFYRNEVRQLYRPGALRALKLHRQAGDRLVLLTSSSNYLSELVAKDLELHAVLCNRIEVNAQGRHTGRSVGRVCFGAGKLAHAQGFAGAAEVRLDACAFYTDSYSDLPVLERVGRPVAVNPDHRLRRHAARRGWEVVDWGRPDRVGPLAVEWMP